MNQRYTQTGKTESGIFYIIYQGRDMLRPLMTFSLSFNTAKLDMEEKIFEYKRAIYEKNRETNNI